MISATLYKLGVTGSMGCGKTYVCNQLEAAAREQSVPLTLFDFDNFRKEILGSTENLAYLRFQAELIDKYGERIIASTGGINRRALAEITYPDPHKLSVADGIVDRAIEEEIERRQEGLNGILLVESPLLAEKDQFDLVDYNVLIVQCPYEVQIQRLRGSDLPLEQVKKRIALQYSNERKETESRKSQRQASRGDLYTFDSISGNIEELFAEILEKSRGLRNG